MKKKYLYLHILFLCCIKVGIASNLTLDAIRVFSVDAHLEIIEIDTPSTIDKIIQLDTTHQLITLPYLGIKDSLSPNQEYWAKLVLQPNLESNKDIAEWVFQFSFTLTHIDLFVKTADSPVQHFQSGIFVPAKNRSFVPNLKANICKISLPQNETTSIYFKARANRNWMKPVFDLTIKPAEVYFQEMHRRSYMNALYLGILFMMCLYNLILFFFTKDRAYVFYSFWLISIGIYMTYNFGILWNWLHPIIFPFHPEYLYYFKTVVYTALIAYLGFLFSFLNIKETFPKWYKYFLLLGGLAIPCFFLDNFIMWYSSFSYNIFDILTISYVLLFAISTSVFCITLARQKDQKLLFSIIGLMAMNIGIFLTVLARIKDIGYTANFFQLGSLFEVIAFSLGLAFRQQASYKEQEKTRYRLKESQLIHEQEQKESNRLKELDRLKTNLYTNITHEFRTPLTAIIGNTKELVKNRMAKDTILRNSQRLLQLVNQILELSKAEAGKLTVQYINADIVAYIQIICETFQALAESKHIRLTYYPEVIQLKMDFDEEKIQEIIQNILSNALRFTEKNGTIILHLQQTQIDSKPFLQIKITDSGIGIAEKELPFIFNRYFQTKGTKSGTGIGLALTKELVQLLDGKIHVTSQLDKGTTFTISLPIHSKASPQEATLTLKESIFREKEITPSTLFYPSWETKDKKHILLIEDNVDLIDYIQLCLQYQYIIHMAQDGEEGIQSAYQLIPDIIISDIMLPQKDGFEICQILKEDLRTSHIPIILLTAKATYEDKILGLKMGADVYLTKPFQKEELLLHIEKLIKNRAKGQYQLEEIKEISNDVNLSPVELDFLHTITKIIEKHLDNSDFKVDYLARELRMSKTQVYRKIKALTGVTPTFFTRRIRMKKALDLLKNSDLTISEIAYQTGFNSPNYFSRLFQSEFGQSPSDTRK